MKNSTFVMLVCASAMMLWGCDAKTKADLDAARNKAKETKTKAEDTKEKKETKREAPARMKLDPKEAPGEARVDLNAATQAQLEALPGIGPSLAGRIIARREKRPFRRVSQLRRVKGIGPAKYRELKDLVRVE